MKQKLTLLLRKARRFLRVHQVFVVVLAVLLTLVVVVIRILLLSNLPEDQTYLDEQGGKVNTVLFNQDAIKQIEALRDSNVSVPSTQLPNGRQNPFSE